MKYRPVYFLVIVVVALLGILYLSNFRLTGYAIFSESSQEFPQGTFENTTFNGTAIFLVGDNVTGAFTSRVLDANISSVWNNVTWSSYGEKPILFVRSCDDSSCSGDSWNEILLNGESNLTNVKSARYFQYRVLFYNTSNGSTILTNVSVDYTVLPISLDINVSSPEQGAVYGYMNSLALNYSISPTPSSCWYSLDGQANVSLPGCTPSIFNVVSNGTHSIVLYANASDGYVSNKIIDFIVYQGYPTVIPVFPKDGSSFNSSLQFDYYVNANGLTGCSLFANFAGSWGTSDTDSSPENGQVNTFSQTPSSDGAYLWGVVCNDLSAQEAVTLNRTINVDRVKPQLEITEPTGTFSSKAHIPISLSVTDASSTLCIYSLTKVGAGTVLVVVMPQCQSTSFNVADDGQYALAVTVSDSAGNTNTDVSDFSVQSSGSTDSGSSDSSSGGGGVSVDVGSLISKISFGSIDAIHLKPGFSESRSIDVFNSGNKFLNNCHLIGAGDYASWIESSTVKSLGNGQKGTFDLKITAPRNVLPGELSVPILAKCDEFQQAKNLNVSIESADFLLNVLGYYRRGTSLIVNYSLEDLTGSDQKVSVHYSLRDSNDLEVTFGDVALDSKASSAIDSSFSFELPKDSYGEFTLLLNATTVNDHSSLSQPVLLTANSATGLAISDNNRRTLTTWAMVLVAAGAVYGAWYFVRRMRLQSPRVSSV